MLKTDELRLPSSCLNRARHDEPVFVLIGRDAEAPATIRAWCRLRVASGRNNSTDPKIIEALELAMRMEQYRERQVAADRAAEEAEARRTGAIAL